MAIWQLINSLLEAEPVRDLSVLPNVVVLSLTDVHVN